jgi:hypothetical protein
MTKNDILKVLKARKEMSLQSFNKETENLQNTLDEQLFKQIIQEYEEDLSTCLGKISKITSKIEENSSKLNCGFYYSNLLNIGSRSPEFTIRDLFGSMTTRRNETCKTFDLERTEKYKAIETEYDKLISVIKSFPSAKVALEYLKELGIELEELPKEPEKCTALTTPINVSLLMMEGIADDNI